MNRPFLRALAKRVGYTVSPVSSHADAAWDYSPKPTMLAHKYPSEESAWRAVEAEVHTKLCEATILIQNCQDMVKEINDGTLQP